MSWKLQINEWHRLKLNSQVYFQMSLKVTILYNKRNVKYFETVTLLVLLLFIYNNAGS